MDGRRDEGGQLMRRFDWRRIIFAALLGELLVLAVVIEVLA